jgi:Sec-independent protein secretion pathway component TatC
MSREPMVFSDLPLSIKICMIGGAIFLGPYLIIQAWREGRREASR